MKNTDWLETLKDINQSDYQTGNYVIGTIPTVTMAIYYVGD